MSRRFFTTERLATAVPLFAILVAPLGVAGQNIGLGIALLAFIILTIQDKARSLKSTLASPTAQQYLLLWGLIIIPITLATISRGDTTEASRFFWGYIFAVTMGIAGMSLRSFSVNRQRLLNVSAGILGLMGLIALSQIICGWKIAGSQILPQVPRAQGFYSHPLTFAYATLVLMPWSLARPMGKPREWQSWVLAASTLVIVVASQSVTVITLTALTMAVLAIRLPGKKLLIFFLIGTGVLVTVVSTPNSISAKLKAVLSGQRGDHETDYADDRMAFWHANWEMFKDAPVTGHGSGLDTSDRKPYYEKIGLGNIKRMYESHNMFLQYAVEGGLVAPLALFAFLAWWSVRLWKFLPTRKWHRLALVATPVVVALGGLTQNSMQDSEVRYMVLLFCGFGLWFTRDNSPDKNS